MRVAVPHRWPVDRAEAEAIQDRLRPRVRVEPDDAPPPRPRLVAGLDVAYAKDDERLAPAYRLPETTRHADRLSREALRAALGTPA